MNCGFPKRHKQKKKKKKWNKKKTNVMSKSEDKPKLSLRGFADDKAVIIHCPRPYLLVQLGS